MTRPTARAVALLLILTLGVGCGGVHLHTVALVVQGVFPDERQLAADNGRRLREKFALEWKFREASGPPRRCLALSGGGIRSAAFSIGALRALNEIDLLTAMDVISGVSGGSYALSWYYMSHKLEPDTKWLTGDDVGPIAQLHDRGFVSLTDYAVLVGGNTLLAPWNFVANGIFGWHVNTTVGRPFYEARIRDTFHGGQEATFDELRELVRSHRLPFFVINTTAYIDDDGGHLGGRLPNTVFEFTPIEYGSDAFGRSSGHRDGQRPQPFPFGLARAVSISGAAVDSVTIAGSSQKTFASIFNQDLNYSMPNFPDNLRTENLNPKPLPVWVHNLLPFPFYFLSGRYQWDSRGVRIHLADGGHAENLGVYSVVRRLCEHIVVVDGEHDPDYRFNSYFKLKEVLREEFGVDTSLSGVDEFLQPAPPSAPRRAQAAQKTVSDERSSIKERAVPYAKGRIQWFPFPGAPNDRLGLTISYIKLALTQSDVDGNFYAGDLSPHQWKNIRDHWGTEARDDNNCHEGDLIFTKRCLFPQESTAHQDFSDQQFRAYRDLGYAIVKHNAEAIKAMLGR